MTDAQLRLDHHRILVVEDEGMIALDLAQALENLGAEVVGPAADIKSARALLADARSPISIAILDINLRGELVFPLADELRARQTPFMFASAYEHPMLPPHFASVPIWGKPLDTAAFARALAGLLANRPKPTHRR